MSDTLERPPGPGLSKPAPDAREAERVRETYRRMGVPITEAGLAEALRASRGGIPEPAAPVLPTAPLPGPPAEPIRTTHVAYAARGALVMGLAALAALVAHQVLVSNPVDLKARAEAERASGINAGLTSTLGAILATRPGQEDEKAARTIATSGLRLLRSGDAGAAEVRLGLEKDLLAVLEPAYSVRVVSRPGERYSVLYRTPVGRPDEPAFYAVVEAVGPDGRPVRRRLQDAETGESAEVSRWAQRIGRPLYQAIAEDKRKDGVVDDALIGAKERGKRAPSWKDGVLEGAITRW